MNNLTPDQFEEFFRSLHGYKPFPWQERLARQVAESRPSDICWPEVLALPTAAGKTACIDVAIFALACQADHSPAERTAPRRIFFVVDRRVIVDETFERGKNLADKLNKAQGHGIIKKVADQLRNVSGEEDNEQPPLDCFVLRGGMYRDDAWARSPLRPTVVVTTVDQFGSRLLFRGYGSSAGMRPIHAGLAANDCLVILDEAHCADPFRQTVDAVRRYRRWAEQPDSIDSVPFHLTLLSATPPVGVKDVFAIGDDDRQHHILGRRIKASKPAKLAVAQNARGNEALERLAEKVTSEAEQLISDDRRAIGIIVNRVAVARAVYQQLNRKGRDAILLTGRMRSIDRDDVADSLQPLKTRANRDGRERFVVATQTLEVGADLDFDGLVTECASLDALRQRFGRLNRAGRAVEARATVVVRADQTSLREGDTTGDPIYGTALAETWQWLKERAYKDVIDFGYEAMDALLLHDVDEIDKLRQRSADAPVMLPAHVDAWVQTSPTPTPDPDPAIFLHGPDRGSPEVQVCWRTDLSEADLSGGGQRAIDIVSLCPPASSECISVPIHALRRWLAGNLSVHDPEDSDIEGTQVPNTTEFPASRVRRQVLCWRGPDDSRMISNRDDLRPSDTVVIPSELKGWSEFGHIPPDSPVDMGDRAYLHSRAKPLLRIHPEMVKAWPEVPARAFFMEIAVKSQSAGDWEELESQIPEHLEALAAEVSDMPQWKWLKRSAKALVEEYGPRRRPKTTPYPTDLEEDTDDYGFVLHGSRRVRKYMRSASTLTSEDDSYSATVRVPMEDHLYGVERWAKRFGERLGLPDKLMYDLTLAARLHDVGKADPRFQAMLRGGHGWLATVAGELLAKSGNLPTSGRESQRAHWESGYPEGSRHELLSVKLIESVPGLLESAFDPDLVLHLVASHHGRCRPFAPVVTDTQPIEITANILGHSMSSRSDTGLERMDSGVPERFWQLVRRYGWWGLSWVEALMRLADHRRSEEEQKASESV